MSEIPDICGLVTITKSGGLRTVRKAPWRDIDPPVEMFKYLMFTYIGAYGRRDSALPRVERLLPSERADLFKKYTEDQATLKEIGWRTGRKIREEIDDLDRENRRLKMVFDDQRAAEKDLAAICKALGITQHYNVGQKCLEAIDQMKRSGGMTPGMVQAVHRLHDLADELEKTVTGNESREESEGESK